LSWQDVAHLNISIMYDIKLTFLDKNQSITYLLDTNTLRYVLTT